MNLVAKVAIEIGEGWKEPQPLPSCFGFRVWGLGLGFGVWGLGFGFWGLGFGVEGEGFRVWVLGFRVWVLGFGV